KLSTPTVKSTIPNQICNGINYILTRFQIEKIVFKSILIDEMFMSMFVRIFSNINKLQLVFSKIFLVDSNSQDHTLRFFQWIVS
ncbi:hypothetical protein PMAYCL1PPCAC_00612, partial [Pristionchus mayeri]